MPADVNLASVGFFVLLRVVTRLSLGDRLPTLFHHRATLHRRHPPSSPCSPNGADTPARICHNVRAHSPNRSAAGLITLLSLDHRQHLPAIGGMTGSRERGAGENGREGAKSRELSSENAEKITANAGLSPDYVAYIVRTSRPRATIAQARKTGPLSSYEGKERTGLYRNAAHDGGGFPWLIR